MASQGEREPGGLVVYINLEPMARDGTSCNFNSRGSSTPYPEHGLCRQTGSHNGGAIAPQRGTEQAAIYSAANGTTRGEHFQQPPLQATWTWQAWQDDYASIGRLQAQLGDVLEKVKRYENISRRCKVEWTSHNGTQTSFSKITCTGGHSDWTIYWNKFGGKNIT